MTHLKFRNVQHIYKYSVDLRTEFDGKEMRIFEIQLTFTGRLANVNGLVTVEFKAEYDDQITTHEWIAATGKVWHDFPNRFIDVDREICDHINRLLLVHQGYRLGGYTESEYEQA